MTDRIAYFDIAKFIGMMMIILGHFGVPDINTFVYTFHIPMFFIISGYFFTPMPSTANVAKIKFRQLIIPYFLVMFATIFVISITNYYNDKTFNYIIYDILSYIVGFIYGSGYVDNVFGFQIKIVGPIWFLLALYWNFIIMNWVIKQKHCKYILMTLFIVGYFSSKFFWLPFSIQSAMTSIIFVYAGYIAKCYNFMDKRIFIGNLLPLLCMWGIGISYKGQFLIVSNTDVFVITDILTAFAASYLVILYSMWLEHSAKSAKIMAFLGKYTLVMLCFHTIDVIAMPWNSYYKTPNISADVIFIKIFITFIKFIFPILGAMLVIRIKFLRKLFAIKN